MKILLNNDQRFKEPEHAGHRRQAASIGQAVAGAAPLGQGIADMVPALGQLEDGLGQLADGQRQAAQGVASFQAGMGQLTDELKQGADGLRQVTDGLGQVQAAQETIAADGKTQIGGWVLPQEALASDSFRQALDFYLSEDGKIA